MNEFNWYIAIPATLAYGILPVITFYFFTRYCASVFRLKWALGYMVLSVVQKAVRLRFPMAASVGLMAEIGLLGICGRLFLKKTWREMFVMSVLLICMFSVSNGIVHWLDQRIFFPIVFSEEALIRPADGVREFLKILLVLGLYIAVLKKFRRCITGTDKETLFLLTIPVLFIALVERIIQASIYGDEIIFDNCTKEVLPMITINHVEMLILQLCACVCLFAVLFSYERIVLLLREQQKIRLIEQRSMEQEHYVYEAKVRYQQTRSFRHDISHHLAVLAELLKMGKSDEALDYLSRLDEISRNLSFPIQTGNVVVDALLGSKLSIAKEKNIRIECEMKIPNQTGISDLDWCIVLANGLDNAMNGCESVPEEQRYIRLTGRKKGNFYLVILENSCDENLLEVPADGTGLGNIREVMEKNKGTINNSVSDGVYRLSLLFVG